MWSRIFSRTPPWRTSLRKNALTAAPAAEPAVALDSLIEMFRQREASIDRAGKYAEENVSDLRAAGLLALNIPSHAGGMGADLSTTIETLRAIAQGSPSTALLLAMQTSVLSHYLLEPETIPASERRAFEKQRTWAWEQALEGKIFAVANSEPGAAGDVRHSQARVLKVPGGLVLNGVKSFASHGVNADFFMAAAHDEADAVEYYLVRNDGASVNAATAWDAVGMRGSESVVLRFTEAPVVGPLAYR